VEALGDEQQEMQHTTLGKLTGGWLTNKLLGKMKEAAITIENLKITPENFAEFITLITTEKVGSSNAQKLLELMLETGAEPDHLMEEHGLGQVRDTGLLEAAVDDVIRAHPDEVAKFKAGKEAVLKFLVGMGMKATQGAADPKMIEEMLKDKLT
jgi:aspartyl-tRNA(Asn)/glutamyl-tRNA(Gln) amidotransferase subunit B